MKCTAWAILVILLAPSVTQASRRVRQPPYPEGKKRSEWTPKEQVIHYRHMLRVLGTSDKDIERVAGMLTRATRAAESRVGGDAKLTLHGDRTGFWPGGRRTFSLWLTVQPKAGATGATARPEHRRFGFLLGPTERRLRNEHKANKTGKHKGKKKGKKKGKGKRKRK